MPRSNNYGQLDASFNNAGVSGGQIDQGGRRVADRDESAFDQAVTENLKAVWLLHAGRIEAFAPHDIRVNSIFPEPIDTPMTTLEIRVMIDQMMAMIPAGRMATTEEVAAKLCLGSDDAASCRAQNL